MSLRPTIHSISKVTETEVQVTSPRLLQIVAADAQGTLNTTNLPREHFPHQEHLEMPFIHSIPTPTAASFTAEMRTLHQFNK